MSEDWKSWSNYVLKSINKIEKCLSELKNVVYTSINDVTLLKTKYTIYVDDLKERVKKLENEVTDINENKLNNVTTKLAVNKVKLSIVIGILVLLGSSITTFLFNYALKIMRL